jgi:hypothetical protein
VIKVNDIVSFRDINRSVYGVVTKTGNWDGHCDLALITVVSPTTGNVTSHTVAELTRDLCLVEASQISFYRECGMLSPQLADAALAPRYTLRRASSHRFFLKVERIGEQDIVLVLKTTNHEDKMFEAIALTNTQDDINATIELNPADPKHKPFIDYIDDHLNDNVMSNYFGYESTRN